MMDSLEKHLLKSAVLVDYVWPARKRTGGEDRPTHNFSREELPYIVEVIEAEISFLQKESTRLSTLLNYFREEATE